jgi:hypothetical protein
MVECPRLLYLAALLGIPIKLFSASPAPALSPGSACRSRRGPALLTLSREGLDSISPPSLTIAPLLFGSLPFRSSHGTNGGLLGSRTSASPLRRRFTGCVGARGILSRWLRVTRLTRHALISGFFFRQVELGTTTFRGPKDLNPKFGVGAKLRSFGGDRNPRPRCLGTRGFSSIIVSYCAGDLDFFFA